MFPRKDTIPHLSKNFNWRQLKSNYYFFCRWTCDGCSTCSTCRVQHVDCVIFSTWFFLFLMKSAIRDRKSEREREKERKRKRKRRRERGRGTREREKEEAEEEEGERKRRRKRKRTQIILCTNHLLHPFTPTSFT